MDQNHEVIKGDGEEVALTENPVELLSWMVAGSEIAKLANEFDEHNNKHDGKRHELSAAEQAEIRKDVSELTRIVCRMGNPCFDDGEYIVALDIKLVMDSSVVQTLKQQKQLVKGNTMHLCRRDLSCVRNR